MKKKIDWIVMSKLNSETELEFFLNQFPPMSSANSNLNNCTICSENDIHKMRAIYPFCRCCPNCPARYLILKCLKTQSIIVKGVNVHPPSADNTNKVEIAKKGIKPKFKEIIEELIYRNISKPFKVYQEILLNHYNDRSRPNLVQIQNYLKYRRKRHGDVNSIEGLEDYVKPKLFKNIDLNSYSQDEPIYFGNHIREGDEQTHFHLGITSKKLLENAKHGCMFHLDCTYKIVKYGFPVLVFGCTDIRRRFYPISYFITSHEQESDFSFFWISLIELANLLDIDLIQLIEYICIDADRASANSVVSNLIKSKIIMCWYHLKANVIFF